MCPSKISAYSGAVASGAAAVLPGSRRNPLLSLTSNPWSVARFSSASLTESGLVKFLRTSPIAVWRSAAVSELRSSSRPGAGVGLANGEGDAVGTGGGFTAVGAGLVVALGVAAGGDCAITATAGIPTIIIAAKIFRNTEWVT